MPWPLTSQTSCHKPEKGQELFGLGVIEYLNYDPQSGHDTHNQKVFFKGHIDLNEIGPSIGFFGHLVCHAPTIGHN